MRTCALILLAAVAASAAPLAVRQLVVGQSGADSKSVNGPTALSNPQVNNGALTEGSIDTSTSLDGAIISNPIGNTLTTVNDNTSFHDNIITNPNINSASDTVGSVVVGNDNQVFRGNTLHGPSDIIFKRQAPGSVSSVNAPAAINDPTVNNGAMREGSTDASLSFDGASVVNPVGNSLTQVNDNTDVSDNAFIDPNWNTVSNNNGPSLAGNNNVFVPINNEGMIVNLDPGFLAAQHEHQQALVGHFVRPGLF
ncbi:hypothetical protein GGH94_004668 [Coemansia aciculifera]|uniref:Uncharacterized protein n=2 Tax=Coemansia TaxID=4863 RepID=A0A9W8H2H6_9FUNG|nr:hypothetical protein GGI19_002567 [Coemansia pectinata]KAJ2861795.1 hypothetical protein GGH94_004668 [Coemansia aciculifera]KAJ2871656.1 hypothetical protein GGH93_004638 [Coemansia aciculifera]KAJ2882750.1 hypothetical protein H4R27_003226 [Coemansia aciculifera]